MIKILFFGDVVGKIGRRALTRTLPSLRKKFKPDLVLANIENLAHGVGITKKTLQEMREIGIDFFTSGDHIWSKREVVEIFADANLKKFLIRPANYPEGVPGEGYQMVRAGQDHLLVINLLGRVFIEEKTDCPFRKVDEILARIDLKKINGIIVDFHAEATSEKVAMSFYLDGRVSALLGTHTHIGTNDAKILSKGTGYLTDIGMVGAKDSIIGVDKENVLKVFLTQMPHHFEVPEKGEAIINAVYLEIDPKTKKTIKIKRVDLETEI